MSQLAIRRVVLYKHGVGYFEREAVVNGNASLTLGFKQKDVSDALKSLTVLDLDGGIISTVSYDSTEPVERRLADMALSLPEQHALLGLLPQLRGARVKVQNEEGLIVGIDRIRENKENMMTEKVHLSIVTDAGNLRTYNLFDVSVDLLDESSRKELDEYLKTLLAATRKDDRTFTLKADGDGERTIRLSYILEAPVWKATYRLLLPEEDSTESPRIQGWAVVDNTSEDDWSDIALSLVAGLPVSFTHDLYTPRYVRRPNIEVKETTGVLPPTAAAGIESVDSMMVSFEEQQEVERSSVAKKMRGQPHVFYNRAASSTPSSMPTQTRERTIGDLFEYAIDTPVTVKKNQSALVPIVLKEFAGKRVLLYEKAARAENPIRCVEFDNTTGLTLEGGPVTVLEAGNYAGEAMLDTMKPSETRLLGYAVELAVRISDSSNSRKQPVSRYVVKGGLLHTYFGYEEKTTYTINSKATKEQTVYIDHPKPSGEWNLAEPEQAHEITENHWRFKLDIAPGKVTKFVVRVVQPQQESVQLSNLSAKQFVIWINQKYIDKPTTSSLQSLLAIRQAMSALDAKIDQHNRELASIAKDQERIRANLTSLGDRSSEQSLRERYVNTLNQHEDRLTELDGLIQSLRSERSAQDEQFATALNKLQADVTLSK